MQDQNKVRDLHSKHKGKLSINSVYPLSDGELLADIYTPGVAEIASMIEQDPSTAKDYTISGKTVAAISDGSAVLGLGDVGPKASLPILEGKAAIFKEFADVDAYPLAIEANSPEEFIGHVRAIAGNFAAINLEDISAPNCFAIENALASSLDIPVMHDDQHATAIAVLAALKSALKITDKDKVRVVITGAGPAGYALTKLLGNTKTILELFIDDIKVIDSKGVLAYERQNLPSFKEELVTLTNQARTMALKEAIKGADVFIGLSRGGILSKEMIATMNPNPIIFALANPDPEIMPDEAINAGAAIVATGRSDFPNQVNNALIFPGVFKGLLESNQTKVTDEMKLRVADTIFRYHESEATKQSILPSILDKELHKLVAKAVAQ